MNEWETARQSDSSVYMSLVQPWQHAKRSAHGLTANQLTLSVLVRPAAVAVVAHVAEGVVAAGRGG